MTENRSSNRDLPDAPPQPSSTHLLASEAVIPIEQVMGQHREVILVHAGQRYRLRLTANDRLILTK